MPNCPKPKQLYPFTQPLVGKVEESLSNSHNVCVNTFDHGLPLKAKGVSLSMAGVDNTKGVAAPSKAAEQGGIKELKEVRLPR